MSAALAVVLELQLLQGLNMLRALQDGLTFGAVSRRELPVSTHLPYTRHVDDWIVRTKTGLLMNFIKLDGFSFQTADWSEINVRMLGRNDLVRTLANSRFAIYSHIIRREVEPRSLRRSTMTCAARSTSATTPASPSGACSSTTST